MALLRLNQIDYRHYSFRLEIEKGHRSTLRPTLCILTLRLPIPLPLKYPPPFLPDGGAAETRKATSNEVASFIFGADKERFIT